MTERSRLPLLVIGGGLAGLCTALAAHPRPVKLITSASTRNECASALAMGGIAAALADDDSPELHAADSLMAGSGSNCRVALSSLTTSAGDAIHWLAAMGVAFDAEEGQWLRCREGGHSRARILHAGGDRTGMALIDVLYQRAVESSHIEIEHDRELIGLRLRDHVLDGALLRDQGGRQFELDAGQLVLACGGPIGAFSESTQPLSNNGAGLELALSAGAKSRDLHLIQFHPTALARRARTDTRLSLVTEALRGAGAILLDQRGRQIMRGLHPLLDLAPRDIVARTVYEHQSRGLGVWLHAQHLPLDWSRRFPCVLQECLSVGVDPRSEPIPVCAAAHFHMGGVAVDGAGRTSIAGLHAVGEVACSGVHGGNRLASNSLLEAVVFGRELGQGLQQPQENLSSTAPCRWTVLQTESTSSRRLNLGRALTENLGPVRSRQRIERTLIDVNEADDDDWQGILLARMLRSALASPVSHGAHFWRED